MSADLTSIADDLARAEETASPIEPLGALSLEQAYEIQRLNLERRVQAGARLTGHKVGLTSDAVQRWLDVDQPDYGGLLDTMCVAEGEAVEHASLIAPRVEAELAFILARPLSGPGVTGAEVIRATECVVPCIEIIDSRVRDWTIGIADTVADNASSARYVLGHQPMRLADIDPRLIGMSLHVRGELVSTGAGLACLGSPINAVAWLANTLGRLGVGLEAGQVILSGALGPVSPVSAGDWVSARVGSASAVSVRFT